MVDGIDRAAGHAQLGQTRNPFILGLASNHIVQEPIESPAVAHAKFVGDEARIAGQTGLAGEIAELGELGIVAHGEDHMPVGCRHDVVRHDIGMLVAYALGHVARGQIIEANIGKPGDLGIEQGEIDVLALARPVAVTEGGQDRGGRIHPAHDVGDSDPHFEGRPIGLACHTHDPAQALGQHVVAGARRVGTRLPEASDGAIDEARVFSGQILVGEAVFGHVPDLEILHHDVAFGDQPARQRLARLPRDVDGERALVAVRAEVIGAFLRILAVLGLDVGRAPFAGVVAGAGPLDLDHIGAQITQELRAGRPGQDAGEVENADTVERA